MSQKRDMGHPALGGLFAFVMDILVSVMEALCLA